jgi:hypothetical protein
MAGISSLESLLKQAAEKNEVPISLLQKILDEERIRLYLFDSARTTVLQNIRAMVQEESQKRE